MKKLILTPLLIMVVLGPVSALAEFKKECVEKAIETGKAMVLLHDPTTASEYNTKLVEDTATTSFAALFKVVPNSESLKPDQATSLGATAEYTITVLSHLAGPASSTSAGKFIFSTLKLQYSGYFEKCMVIELKNIFVDM